MSQTDDAGDKVTPGGNRISSGCDYEICAGVASLGTDGRVTHRSSGAGCLLLRDLPALHC